MSTPTESRLALHACTYGLPKPVVVVVPDREARWPSLSLVQYVCVVQERWMRFISRGCARLDCVIYTTGAICSYNYKVAREVREKYFGDKSGAQRGRGVRRTGISLFAPYCCYYCTSIPCVPLRTRRTYRAFLVRNYYSKIRSA